jgi:hypothetical protein
VKPEPSFTAFPCCLDGRKTHVLRSRNVSYLSSLLPTLRQEGRVMRCEVEEVELGSGGAADGDFGGVAGRRGDTDGRFETRPFNRDETIKARFGTRGDSE